jgi:hypothetical protein
MIGAAGTEAGASTQQKPAKEAAKQPVTPEMETAAISFVSLHHPELAELINQLKGTNSDQYQQAIRDLSRTAATLANTQKNDPTRYELDLKLWQMNSHIQVIAARLAMAPTPELKESLKSKLLEQIDLRLEIHRLDRERVEARLKRIDDSITRLRDSREQEAAKAFERLTRSTAKPGARKTAKSAAGATKTDSSTKPAARPK